jgi:hypothetical protein
MPWIRTPAGTLVPDDFLDEVQQIYNLVYAIERCRMSEREKGLLRDEMTNLELDLDKEYTNECDDSWDDRSELEVVGRDDVARMAGWLYIEDGAGKQTQNDGTNEDKDKTREAGELTQDVKVEVERVDELRVGVGAGEQTCKEFEVDVGAGERTQEGRVRAAESTQVRAAESTGGTSYSCCGSVVDWVKDWMEDSVIIDIGADATKCGTELNADGCGIEGFAAWLDSLACGGSVETAEDSVVDFAFVKEKLILFDDDAEGIQMDSSLKIGCISVTSVADEYVRAAGFDSFVAAGRCIRRSIIFDDDAECICGDADYYNLKIGCSFVTAVADVYIRMADFGSNIPYDPGGSVAGLSSWGLLVSSVFASVEAHSGVVIVLLRSPWFCCGCEIMSFGALELWRVGRLNTLYLAIAG